MSQNKKQASNQILYKALKPSLDFTSTQFHALEAIQHKEGLITPVSSAVPFPSLDEWLKSTSTEVQDVILAEDNGSQTTVNIRPNVSPLNSTILAISTSSTNHTTTKSMPPTSSTQENNNIFQSKQALIQSHTHTHITPTLLSKIQWPPSINVQELFTSYPTLPNKLRINIRRPRHLFLKGSHPAAMGMLALLYDFKKVQIEGSSPNDIFGSTLATKKYNEQKYLQCKLDNSKNGLNIPIDISNTQHTQRPQSQHRLPQQPLDSPQLHHAQKPKNTVADDYWLSSFTKEEFMTLSTATKDRHFENNEGGIDENQYTDILDDFQALYEQNMDEASPLTPTSDISKKNTYNSYSDNNNTRNANDNQHDQMFQKEKRKRDVYQENHAQLQADIKKNDPYDTNIGKVGDKESGKTRGINTVNNEINKTVKRRKKKKHQDNSNTVGHDLNQIKTVLSVTPLDQWPKQAAFIRSSNRIPLQLLQGLFNTSVSLSKGESGMTRNVSISLVGTTGHISQCYPRYLSESISSYKTFLYKQHPQQPSQRPQQYLSKDQEWDFSSVTSPKFASSTHGIRSMVQGEIVVFDRHCNLVIKDAIEAFWHWEMRNRDDKRCGNGKSPRKRQQSTARTRKRAEKQREYRERRTMNNQEQFDEEQEEQELKLKQGQQSLQYIHGYDKYQTQSPQICSTCFGQRIVEEENYQSHQNRFDNINNVAPFPDVSHLLISDILPNRTDDRDHHNQSRRNQTESSDTYSEESVSYFTARMRQRDQESLTKQYSTEKTPYFGQDDDDDTQGQDQSMVVNKDCQNKINLFQVRDQYQYNDHKQGQEVGTRVTEVQVQPQPGQQQGCDQTIILPHCKCQAHMTRIISPPSTTSKLKQSKKGHWVIKVSQKPLLFIQGHIVSSISL